MDGYDVAQYCREGHLITSMAGSYPQHREEFCGKCGAATITECPECGTSIRGYYHVSGVIGGFADPPRPSFCTSCGKPYPWTVAAMDAAREMADEVEGLEPDEREALKGTIDDLVRDTARTPVATTRFKRLVGKAGTEAASGFRDVLIAVVTDAARKGIWGP